MTTEKTWRTPLDVIPKTKEVNDEASKVVPGQVKPISEMLKRVQMGFDWDFNGLEYTESDIPLPRPKDLTDLDEIRNNLKYQATKVAGKKQAGEGSGENTAVPPQNAE